ncbi:MAG: hypothetical protein PHZ09_11565, partial [Eubacteriales bacterium]|nr:hypothetical protein [Eubacteriales bacterium]
MKIYIKYFILFLILLLLFSCNSTNNVKLDSSDIPVNTIVDISAFTIVRGDTSTENVTQAAVELRRMLEDITGVRIDLQTDWTKRGTDITRFEREIIIGKTNRSESESLYTEFDNAPEHMDYIIRTSGKHIVIALNDNSATEAVRVFIESFILQGADGMSVADNLDLSSVHVFPVKRFEIAGNNIGEYSIIYPASYTEYQKRDIALFRDIVYTGTGKRLEIADDSEENSSKLAIKIGTAGDSEFADYHPLDYHIMTDESGISIGGNNYYADIKGLYHFLYNIIGYTYDGNFSKNEI